MRAITSCFAGLSLCAAVSAAASHPRLYVSPGERDGLLERLESTPWMRTAYQRMRERLIPYVQRHARDPEWITARILMNWDTHYITPVVADDAWVRGEGRAPVPTPRYAGARDWSADYGLPGIDDLRPYNDKNGLIWARDRQGDYAWVHPSKTGHSIEKRNRAIVDLARDAAFVYWLTGDEQYAAFACDIFWQYMHGFSYKQAPHDAEGRVVGSPGGPRHIYGMHTFEVIHEDIVESLALTYDFLYEHLVRTGRDVAMCQAQFKRMAARIVDGGGREGNWNLHQAETIAYAGLVLEDDDAYEDGQGRQHTIDVVLNADMPHQLGLNHVIRNGYDQETGIWPEAFGYGTGVTVSITRIASLIARQQQGRSVLDDPVLAKAATVQFQWLHPHGRSIGLGDTTHAHARTVPLELLIAHARRKGQGDKEHIFTTALQHEIRAGRYDRSRHTGLFALCSYVPELRETSPSGNVLFQRTFHGAPLNAVIQRSITDDQRTSLMAAMYGTRGGHTHANGLAMELFGAGEILGPDPGAGSSYWRPDHGHYYKQRPAHNTVIVDGTAVGRIPMTLLQVEPADGEPGVSPRFSVMEASLGETRPGADQHRCLATVRLTDALGFYVDIFRSTAHDPAHQSHDYLYHNLGQSAAWLDAAGDPLPLEKTDLLGSEHGDQKGYDYFENERSALVNTTFRVRFRADFPEKTVGNSVWVCGKGQRRLYALDAPRIIRGERCGLPRDMARQPLSAMLIRQPGEAWLNPFIVLYEPTLGKDARGAVRNVLLRPSADRSVVVDISGVLPASDTPFTLTLIHGVGQEADPNAAESGLFAACLRFGQELQELYLGHGRQMQVGSFAIAAMDNGPVSASVHRHDHGWVYAASGPVRVTVPKADGAGDEVLTMTLPSGSGPVPAP